VLRDGLSLTAGAGDWRAAMSRCCHEMCAFRINARDFRDKMALLGVFSWLTARHAGACVRPRNGEGLSVWWQKRLRSLAVV
jgi:hypothetical protein